MCNTNDQTATNHAIQSHLTRLQKDPPQPRLNSFYKVLELFEVSCGFLLKGRQLREERFEMFRSALAANFVQNGTEIKLNLNKCKLHYFVSMAY